MRTSVALTEKQRNHTGIENTRRHLVGLAYSQAGIAETGALVLWVSSLCI